jgi:IPT/TIG domain
MGVRVRRRRGFFRRLSGAVAVSALMSGVLVSGLSTAGAATSAPAPVVSSVSPSVGTAGDTHTTAVMISGANFTGATAVTFGSEDAPGFQVDSPTLIAVNTPTAMAGTVDVTVTTPAGTSATSPKDQFVFQGPSTSPPVVTSLSPSSAPGLNDQGYPGAVEVVIEGDNFIGATAINFGSDAVPASLAYVNTANEIQIEGPGAPAGTVVDITVTTAAGTSALSPADRFTYTAPLPADGYWEAAADGGVFSFGNAPFYGSMGGTHLNAPVVGISVDRSQNGYLEVASDGGIFTFGDAEFHGSMGGTHLDSPIVGMALDPYSGGYWEVAADGGVFSFDAPFLGSLGGKHLSSPIVGMATSINGSYWLAAADGTVYYFGAAPNLGSLATSPSNPVVGITSDPFGGASGPSTEGYWLVTADGAVSAFGGALDDGSAAGIPLNKPMVGMTIAGGAGYMEAAADGGIFTYGTPDFYGSMGGIHLNAPIVGIASNIQPLGFFAP